MGKTYLLIVDRDGEYLKKIQDQAHGGGVPAECVRTPAEAEQALSDPARTILGAFIGSNLDDQGWVDVVRSAHVHRPGVPLYLVHDGKFDLPEAELRKLGVRQALGKPVDLRKMVEIVAPLVEDFDIDQALKASREPSDKGASIASADDRHYSAIRADNFLSGNKVLFDVFIRLPSGQYLKVIHAGDAFDAERLDGYLRKGVLHFYIRKEVHETYLRYCHHFTSRLVRAGAPLEAKISQTLNHGQETLSFLTEHKFGEQDLHQVSNFVSNVQELFLQFNPRSNDLMSKFLEDLVLYEHAVGTTMVGCLLGRELKFESWYALHILGMSCLLHDIGLQGMPDHFKDEDESRLTESELKEFRKHPEIGAAALKQVPDLAPTVSQAALQHHVRRSRKGFPSIPRGETVHVVSEIVGLSDEFCQLIKRSTIDTSVNPLKEMKERVLAGFSKPVQDAFRDAFLKRLSQS